MPYPSSVLYFPSIEFRDEAFLKRSLLYWDKVLRIVPEDYVPKDSDFVKALSAEGLVKDIRVSDETQVEVADKFMNMVTAPNRAAGLSLQSYDLRYDGNDMGRLHQSKIYHVLRDIFEDMGFKLGKDGFLKVPSQLAAYYMLVLAHEIARNRQIPLATDSPEIWSITPCFTENNNFAEISTDTDGVNCLTSLTIDSIMPAHVGNIGARHLIALAKDSRDARKSLRQHIGEAIDRIQTITCREQMCDELDGLVDEIERDKDEYRQSQTFWNSDQLTSCLNLNIPTLATLFPLAGQSVPLRLGCIAFTLVQYIRNCHLLKKKRSASYQAYLVGLDKKASANAIARTPARINEFIYD